MAAATIEICESNGAGQTITHNITNLNYGSVDVPNLTASVSPITVGVCSFGSGGLTGLLALNFFKVLGGAFPRIVLHQNQRFHLITSQ